MNVYVGNGHKYEENTYFPVNPPVVNEDPKEYDIQPEPTPLEEPIAAEEKKEEGEGDADGDGGEEDAWIKTQKNVGCGLGVES